MIRLVLATGSPKSSQYHISDVKVLKCFQHLTETPSSFERNLNFPGPFAKLSQSVDKMMAAFYQKEAV